MYQALPIRFPLDVQKIPQTKTIYSIYTQVPRGGLLFPVASIGLFDANKKRVHLKIDNP